MPKNVIKNCDLQNSICQIVELLQLRTEQLAPEEDTGDIGPQDNAVKRIMEPEATANKSSTTPGKISYAVTKKQKKKMSKRGFREEDKTYPLRWARRQERPRKMLKVIKNKLKSCTKCYIAVLTNESKKSWSQV